ncbi:MAG: flagellar hook capping protein [Lachnospiraceae bacterium]|nr:flagellar hook capping protein [Lachnospiraceae bacterium]
MALVAPVKDGAVVETTSQASLSKEKSSAGKDMDKDTFLQLLVAQMKYQDPMEPTSNTEYIAQYAQFSQVEAISNMATTMDLSRASSLVGQEVYIKTTGSNGNTDYVQGRVDYVVFENGKPYLSIDESLYSLDDLDTVVDTVYQKAYDGASDFTVKLNKLPSVNNITISTDGKTIDELASAYDAMNDYEKSFVAQDTVARFKKYVEQLEALRAAALTSDSENDADAGISTETEEAD